ncbi:hypothetical protein OIV83_005416 [Microbotryomycetes sp. JL201]|nr:hypothetical protein OIV83_005416 [Microbotryomycetes sp. JL201]
MPLDSNLYTLTVQGRKDHPSLVDFVEEPNKEARYTASRQEANSAVLRDAWTDTTLARLTVTGQKSRVVQLLDPESTVDLTNPGSFSWQWLFEWEHVRLKWERTSPTLLGSQRCYSLSVRIDPAPQDRKGLEVVALITLVGFVDGFFGDDAAPLTIVSEVDRNRQGDSRNETQQDSAPAPRQAPVQIQVGPPAQAKSAKTFSLNEIEVTDPSKREDDLKQCLALLKDEKILWIVLIGSSKEIVPHVAALAERVKTQRYKASGEELNQYIDDDQSASSGKYASPKSIRIYLSRIELADMLPNYNRRQDKKPRPPVRPPINFDEPAPVRPPDIQKSRASPHVASDEQAGGNASAQGNVGRGSNWFGWPRK